MKGMTLEAAALCMLSGAALGALYAVFAGLRALFRAGRGLTFFLDFLFCLTAGCAVFLIALAAGNGRPRALELCLMGLGGWAAGVLFTPLLAGGAQRLRRALQRARGFLKKFFVSFCRRGTKRPASAGKIPKKREKGT